LKCPRCFHIKRDVKLCNANAREHAWGGDELFDKIRTALTFLRFKPLLQSSQKNILEIGFGSGLMLERFIKQGYSTSGVEANYMEKDTHHLEKEAVLYLDKIENIKLPENTFDFIYGIHLIEHVDSPKILLSKCFHALKKGGKIYFITPNGKSKGLEFFKENWWNLEDPTHIRFFSEKSLTFLLRKSGFKVIKTGKPFWDSLTLEINSLHRIFEKNKTKHGILNNKLLKISTVLLLPISILLRVIDPNITPSIEIIATKE